MGSVRGFKSLRHSSKLLTNRTKESVRANAGNQCVRKAKTGYQGRKGSGWTGAPKILVERSLLAFETGDPDECGWPREPEVCMGLVGMGECTEAQDSWFSRKETRKATGLKTGIHWSVRPIYAHDRCTFLAFYLFLHRVLLCSPGWSGALSSRLPQNVRTSSVLPPILN